MNKLSKSKLSLAKETIRAMKPDELTGVAGAMRDTRYECGDSKNYCATDLCSRILCNPSF